MKKMKSSPQEGNSFNNRIHNLGITTTLIVWAFFLLVPISVCAVFKLNINVKEMLVVAAPIALIFMITGICEKLSMAPIIGPRVISIFHNCISVFVEYILQANIYLVVMVSFILCTHCCSRGGGYPGHGTTYDICGGTCHGLYQHLPEQWIDKHGRLQ